MCNPGQLELQCTAKSAVVVIVSARFGRFDRNACGVGDPSTCEHHGSYYFDTLSELCFKKRWCTYRVDQKEMHFAEACPGVNKYLSVTYDCVESNDALCLC